MTSRQVLIFAVVLMLTSGYSICRTKAADVVKVAVVDTGYTTPRVGTTPVICTTGHFNFRTKEKEVGYDIYGQGTKMSQIIHEEIGKSGKYCIQVYNVTIGFSFDITAIAKSIVMATDNGAKAINISLRGPGYSEEEHAALKYASKKGVRVFVAAGNEKTDLNRVCAVYPACYKGIGGLNTIGALDQFYNRASYSNFGSFLNWYPGYKQGVHGTSTSTAVATGRYVRYLLEKK